MEYLGSSHFIPSMLRALIIIAFAVVGNILARKAIKAVIHRSVPQMHLKTEKDKKQRADTLISILSTTTTIIIGTTALLLILSTLGVDITPLLASAGIAGVALGFGAQTIVKDFLAGLFILLENQYRVGDVLQVNQGVAGVVEKITLRSTTLRDLEGRVHYIPNGVIEIATNMTLEFASVDVNIGIAYDSDIDAVEKVINKVGEQLFDDPNWKGVVLEPAKMLRVDSFDDSAITVKIVCKTAPIRQWDVKSEILRRVKKAFDKEGIEIPFPQRVMHTSAPKKTSSKSTSSSKSDDN
jgi:moderate conductance mechanosensitive channel